MLSFCLPSLFYIDCGKFGRIRSNRVMQAHNIKITAMHLISYQKRKLITFFIACFFVCFIVKKNVCKKAQSITVTSSIKPLTTLT